LNGPGDLLKTETKKVFDEVGGTIGRSPACDWSLPDPENFVSGHHASILWQDGEFYLIDTSTNGTFVNNMPDPIPSGKPQLLTHEDQVTIGNYQIEISLDPKDAERAEDCSFDISTILVQDKAFKKQQLPKKRPVKPAPKKINPLRVQAYRDMDEPTGSWAMLELDDLDGAGGGDTAKLPTKVKKKRIKRKKNGGPAESAAASDAEVMSLSLEEPPAPLKSKKKKAKKPDSTHSPENFKRAKVVNALTPKKKKKPRKASTGDTDRAPQKLAPSANNNQMLDAFTRGLGVDEDVLPNRNPADLMEDVGRIFAVMLEGLQELLQSRALLKERLQLSRTMIKSKSNNPIKFSAGIDDALPRLLSSKPGSYKEAEDAVRECFFDVNADMESMNEAMRRALFEYLKMFDPENLQEQFQHVLGKSKLLGSNKRRYWELYAERYRSLTEHREGRLPDGYASPFVDAFENASSKRKYEKGPK
jgi:type VI secretion system FHA domain protein